MSWIVKILGWALPWLKAPSPEIVFPTLTSRISSSDERDKEIFLQKYSHDIFPSAGDLADLSNYAYQNNTTLIKPMNMKFHYYILPSSVTGKKMKGDWIVLAVAHSKTDKYYGTAFYDVRRKHLVIAHRGTQLLSTDSLHDIACDLAGIHLGRRQDRVISAYRFTCDMINRFASISISITTTGHSLGGWLAQTTAFYLKHHSIAEKEGITYTPLTFIKTELDLEYWVDKDEDLEIICGSHIFCDHKIHFAQPDLNNGYHLHTVVFDSPSSRTYLDKTLQNYSDTYTVSIRESEYNSLDITSYIAYHNIINSCGRAQIGLVRYISDSNETISIFNSHSIKRIITVLRTQPDSIRDVVKTSTRVSGSILWTKDEIQKALKAILLDNGRRIPNDNTNFKTKPLDPNVICRLSLFNDEEQAFLNEIHVRLALMENEYDATCNYIDKKYLKIFQSFRITDGLVCFNKKQRNQSHSDFIKQIKILCMSSNRLSTYMKNNPTKLEACLQVESNEYLNQIPSLVNLDSESALHSKIQEFLSIQSSSSRILNICINNDNKYTENQLTSLCAANALGILNYLGTIDDKIKEDYIGETTSFISNGVSTTKMLAISSGMLNRLQGYAALGGWSKNGNNNKNATIFDVVGLVVIEILDQDPGLDFVKEMLNTVQKLHKNVTNKKLILISSNEGHFGSLGQEPNVSVESSDLEINFDNLSAGDSKKILKSYIEVQGKSYRLQNLVSLNKCSDFSSDVLFSLIKGELISMGNVSSCKKPKFYIERTLKLSNEVRDLHENELIEATKGLDTVILCDVAGMGKSATSKTLFSNLLSCRTKNWIIYIDLSLHKQSILKSHSLQDLLGRVEGIIDSKFKMSTLNAFINKKRVQVLLDGFDEIDTEMQDRLLSFLNNFKGGKTWITARPFAVDLITTRSNVKTQILKFVTLTQHEREDFLLKFWKHKLEHLTPSQVVKYPNMNRLNYKDFDSFRVLFIEFTSAALNHIVELVPNNGKILGIPLQLDMLARINKDNFLNYANTKALYEIPLENINKYIKTYESRKNLYREYVYAKYCITFKKRQLSNLSAHKFYITSLTRTLDELHSKAGFHCIFESDQRNCRDIVGLLDLIKSAEIIENDKVIELNGHGLIFKHEGKFHPIHDTIAMYFSAIFLITCVPNPSYEEYQIEFLRCDY